MTSSAPLRILLVEDNYPDALFFRQLLDSSRIDYYLKVCEDGETAHSYLIDCARARRELPDIILLEIDLPKLSGLDVLRRIRANPALRKLPAVIVTDSDDPDDLKSTQELEASYIRKPADLDKLCAVIAVLENACVVEEDVNEVTPNAESIGATVGEDLEDKAFSVLLVENTQYAHLMHHLLHVTTDPPFHLEAVSDIASALKILSETKFDVIALDLELSDSVGLAGLSKVLRLAVNTPVVVTSAGDQQSVGMEAVLHGAQDYLVKDAPNFGESLARALKFAIHRKRAEVSSRISLIREQHVLQEALQKAPIFVIRIDRNLKILDVNSTIEMELASDKTTVVGRALTDVFPDFDQADLMQLLNQGMPFKEQGQPISQVADSARQNTFWDLLAWPVQRLEGSVSEAIIIGIDVSEKVKAEHQRDEFVQTLAHDIKNPILGEHRVLTALLERYADVIQPSVVEGGLKAILKSNESLIHMLTNLLEAYKIESNLYRPSIVSVKVVELITRAMLELATLLTMNKVQVVTNFDEKVTSINGDPIALQRLLMNILHNAAQYTPAEGEVRISTTAKDKHLFIEISNTGAGILPEHMKYLFQRFASTGNKYRVQSTGLGLYICRRIVEAHHGNITCKSEPNKLTTFTIQLPIKLPSDSYNELPSMASLRKTFII